MQGFELGWGEGQNDDGGGLVPKAVLFFSFKVGRAD